MIINQISSGNGISIIGTTESSVTADSDIQKGEFIQILNETQSIPYGYWYYGSASPTNYDHAPTFMRVRSDGKLVIATNVNNQLYVLIATDNNGNITIIQANQYTTTISSSSYTLSGKNLSNMHQITDDIYILTFSVFVYTYQIGFWAIIKLDPTGSGGYTDLSSSQWGSMQLGTSTVKNYSTQYYDLQVVDSTHIIIASNCLYDSTDETYTYGAPRASIYTIDLNSATMTYTSGINFTATYSYAGDLYARLLPLENGNYILCSTPRTSTNMYFYEMSVDSSYVLTSVTSGNIATIGGYYNKWVILGNDYFLNFPAYNSSVLYKVYYSSGSFSTITSTDLSSYISISYTNQFTIKKLNSNHVILYGNEANYLYRILIVNISSNTLSVDYSYSSTIKYCNSAINTYYADAADFCKTPYSYLILIYCTKYVSGTSEYAHPIIYLQRLFYSSGASPSTSKIDGVATSSASEGDTVTFITDSNYVPGSVYSPATASASEIVEGYTAWSNGELLTGTYAGLSCVYSDLVTVSSTSITFTCTKAPKIIIMIWIATGASPGTNTTMVTRVMGYLYDSVNLVRAVSAAGNTGTYHYWRYAADLTTTLSGYPTCAINGTSVTITANSSPFVITGNSYRILAFG